MGIEGAIQTIFVRSIAVGSPERYLRPRPVEQKTQRIRATIRSVKRRFCG